MLLPPESCRGGVAVYDDVHVLQKVNYHTRVGYYLQARCMEWAQSIPLAAGLTWAYTSLRHVATGCEQLGAPSQEDMCRQHTGICIMSVPDALHTPTACATLPWHAGRFQGTRNVLFTLLYLISSPLVDIARADRFD